MAGTSWPSLVAGRKAKASEVESKFDWLEGSLVPMSGGSTTDGSYDLGSTTAQWNNCYVKTAYYLNGTNLQTIIAIYGILKTGV